jgi:hypothetical protein
MSQGVTRLIEATVKFRKLAFVGLSKKYQGKVRGNPGRPRDDPSLRRHLFAGDLCLLFELCLGGHPGRETQPYRLQVGAGGDRHCGGPLCHRPHGLAALVLVEQHQGNSCNWMSGAPTCLPSAHRRRGQSAESVWCACLLRQRNSASPKRTVRILGGAGMSKRTPRLAVSLGQRRDPDGGADYWTLWPLGLGSL